MIAQLGEICVAKIYQHYSYPYHWKVAAKQAVLPIEYDNREDAMRAATMLVPEPCRQYIKFIGDGAPTNVDETQPQQVASCAEYFDGF